MGISIAISLFVSFTLTPMLASRWLRLDVGPDGERKKSALEKLVNVFYRPVEAVYMHVLSFLFNDEGRIRMRLVNSPSRFMRAMRFFVDRRWIVGLAAL